MFSVSCAGPLDEKYATTGAGLRLRTSTVGRIVAIGFLFYGLRKVSTRQSQGKYNLCSLYIALVIKHVINPNYLQRCQDIIGLSIRMKCQIVLVVIFSFFRKEDGNSTNGKKIIAMVI